MKDGTMKVSFEDFGPVRLIKVQDTRIDAACAIQFKDAMREVCVTGPDRFVLDLSTVDFLDSSGLGAVVAALKAMPDGHKLELSGLTQTVRKVFHLTRMDTVFVIHDNSATAIEGRANAS